MREDETRWARWWRWRREKLTQWLRRRGRLPAPAPAADEEEATVLLTRPVPAVCRYRRQGNVGPHWPRRGWA